MQKKERHRTSPNVTERKASTKHFFSMFFSRFWTAFHFLDGETVSGQIKAQKCSGQAKALLWRSGVDAGGFAG